ncbi:MAG: hypothetical protein ACYSYL_14785 [Planctomycetota bacterium]|jgi:hypothetical protein
MQTPRSYADLRVTIRGRKRWGQVSFLLRWRGWEWGYRRVECAVSGHVVRALDLGPFLFYVRW